jgi:hypothetical protein
MAQVLEAGPAEWLDSGGAVRKGCARHRLSEIHRPKQRTTESETSDVKLTKTGAISAIGGAAAAIGGSAALVAFTAVPAWAQSVSPDPYPVPQSSPGIPNLSAVSVTASGLTAGTSWYAGTCDGVPFTNPGWSPPNDCGPFSGANVVPASTDSLTFGGNPETSSASNAFLLWHGSNGDDTVFGEMPFNCLAPDDPPAGPTTTEGNLPIDPSLPSWGSSAGENPGVGGGTAPCQITVTENANSFLSNNLQDPINLTATAPIPQSPVAIALPVGAAVLLVGGAAAIGIRRRRRNHAVAA